MRIALIGGGSGGPVTPLLALIESLADRGIAASYLWFGLAAGPDRHLCRDFANLRYVTLPSFRLHRFWTWRNLWEPFTLLWSLPKAIWHLANFKPQVVVSAGSFLAVPVGLAARVLRIPHLAHQQDIVPSLTNRILARLGVKVTAVFPGSAGDFPPGRVTVTGNPMRKLLREMVIKSPLLRSASDGATEGKPATLVRGDDGALPLVVVTGGGTGALGLNEMVWQALPSLLPHCRIVHLTGAGKGRAVTLAQYQERYDQREFADHQSMLELMRQASVVVSRAGLATLTELAALAKATIVVPIPDSHQELNASYLAERRAAVRIEQRQKVTDLVKTVLDLLDDPERRQALGQQLAGLLPDGTDAFREAVVSLVGEEATNYELKIKN